MWGKAEQYLKKMGGLILVASIIIWFLSYYPRTSISDTVSETTVEESFVQQQNSYIGRIGQFIEPVLEPLGFNWKVSIALISGTAAKELVVSTIGVLYSEAASDDDATLSAKLTAPNPQTGHPDFTPLIAISFMAFVLLYIPCIATIVAVANEAGSWKWGLFTIIYNTGVAWIVSFLIYNIGKLFI